MFATQPLLSCCLVGLPLGVLSVICYTLCSTDACVDRDEIYGDEDDDEGTEDDGLVYEEGQPFTESPRHRHSPQDEHEEQRPLLNDQNRRSHHKYD